MSRVRDSVTGEYSGNGYAVTLNGQGGATQVYSAGCNPSDSQAGASPGLGLRQLRRFCIRTCREIASELGVAYGGVSRVQEEETA